MSHSTSGHSFGEQLEAVGIAYGSSTSLLRFVETERGRQLTDIELTEYENPSENKEQFIGTDDDGNRVCFDVKYNSVGVETVKVLFGSNEQDIGESTVVLLERDV